ncbi:hypothetical protein [Ferrimonas sp.]|uniref:hypothetical protein n=1 Tax=Ferrimonas sp. TaxID=2080861 RepID=UPI003A91F36C
MKHFFMTRVSCACALALAAPLAPAHAGEGIDLGGIVRANYKYIDYSEASKDKGGDFAFEMLSLKTSGEINGIGLFVDYRFYDGYDTARYAYATYQLNDSWTLNGGLAKVPFGNPGYISNSFWFGVPYYLGFEDDYDMGVTGSYVAGDLTLDLGFFKNAEYSATNNQRYSVDLFRGEVNGNRYSVEEANQLNLRGAYRLTSGDLKAVLGASVEVGQVYDADSGDTGNRHAYAVHADLTLNRWNLMLQYMGYQFDTLSDDLPDTMAVSASGWQYEVAAEAQIVSANLAYTIPFDWGSVKLYNDYGVLISDTDNAKFEDSIQNVTGMAIAAGPTYTYVDFITGKNMVYSGTNNHVGLAQTDSGWDYRININFGYYF